MKKIMFNDRYGLTKAVLEGRKTMTRRVKNEKDITHIVTSDSIIHNVDKGVGSYHEYTDKDGKVWIAWSPFKIGDEVAVAQCYKDIDERSIVGYRDASDIQPGMVEPIFAIESAGWTNKMFVRADLMPNRIRITDIKFERLNDISDEDCLSEGVIKGKFNDFPHEMYFPYLGCKDKEVSYYAQSAFAYLINKVSGRGTWESNPYVFAYSFTLID